MYLKDSGVRSNNVEPQDTVSQKSLSYMNTAVMKEAALECFYILLYICKSFEGNVGWIPVRNALAIYRFFSES